MAFREVRVFEVRDNAARRVMRRQGNGDAGRRW
jgi:hypothetical protein